jgi:hypothetical protein
VVEESSTPAASVGENLPVDYESSQAVSQYAAEVLGISVEVLGSASREWEGTIPASAQNSLNAAVDLAGVTYAAFLQGGAASVSLGEGSISGDLKGDIQDASLGAYALMRAGSMPANEVEALALVRETYPGIANLPYTLQEISEEQSGGRELPGPGGGGALMLPTPERDDSQLPEAQQTYVFAAQTQQNEIDVRNGQAKVVAVAALVGVSPAGPGRVNIFAVIGKGALAGAIEIGD